MLFMASGSSPRCFFQLRAQIQTVVEVFVSKLGFEGKRDGGAQGLGILHLELDIAFDRRGDTI